MIQNHPFFSAAAAAAAAAAAGLNSSAGFACAAVGSITDIIAIGFLWTLLLYN